MQYFLGILSFFGLDEYSRLERKYAKEIEGKADNQFEEELKDVLRRGILETKVKAFPFFTGCCISKWSVMQEELT